VNLDREEGGGQCDPHARLLVLTRNFPPVIGGIERVVAEAVQALRAAFDVTVIGPRGGRQESSGLDYREIAAQPASVFLAQSILRAVGAARQLRPSWVLAGSGVMAPAAMSAARRTGCPAWAFVHGLDVTTQHPLYRSFFVPAIRRLDGVIANSHATAEAARCLGAGGGNIVCIHPGVDLPAIPCGEERIRFRRNHGLPVDARILLFVGRFISRKGLGPFIDRALLPVVSVEPRAHLVVVGAPPAQALGRGAQGQTDLERRAARLGLADRVHFLGPLTGAPLSEAYGAADVHIFPVLDRHWDLEGFGLVALEAAAHGLHTVAFATGGVPDAVSVPESGRLVQPDDYEGFVQAILEVLSDPQRSGSASARRFAETHTWAQFRARIESLARAQSKPTA